MKRIFVITLITLFSMTLLVNAQTQLTPKEKTVTKFLGIPIDGTKREMVQKLINKGFEYNSEYDCLEGEFNGYDVNVHVVTNNNKVYRIMVEDAHTTNETNIKIRFNNLCKQFNDNDRYFSLSDYKIPDNDDISYEMSVKNKRYEASFYQINIPIDSTEIINDLQNYLHDKYGDGKSIENMTDTEKENILMEYFFHYLENFSVWFMIDEKYGKYRILMYYDNLYNQANGEDL